METDWKKGGRKGGKGFSGSKQQAFFSHSTPPPSSPLLSSLFSARPFNFALYNPPSSSSLFALFHTPHFSSTLAIPAPRLSRQTLLPPNPPTTPHRPSQKRRQQQTAYSKGGLGGKGARQEKKGVEGGRAGSSCILPVSVSPLRRRTDAGGCALLRLPTEEAAAADFAQFARLRRTNTHPPSSASSSLWSPSLAHTRKRKGGQKKS